MPIIKNSPKCPNNSKLTKNKSAINRKRIILAKISKSENIIEATQGVKIIMVTIKAIEIKTISIAIKKLSS